MHSIVGKKSDATAADDNSRMEAIMNAYETALLRYATRLTGNQYAAQDVVQNVFIKLCDRWNEALEPSAKLKNWLYRVTHNEAVDYVRRESRRRDLHEKAAEEQELQSHSSPTADRKAQVMVQLKRLKPHEQQVVLLRLQEGCSYAQISEITGRSQGNVGNILHHAVTRLAGLVANAGGAA